MKLPMQLPPVIREATWWPSCLVEQVVPAQGHPLVDCTNMVPCPNATNPQWCCPAGDSCGVLTDTCHVPNVVKWKVR
jgi:hypothetical protein